MLFVKRYRIHAPVQIGKSYKTWSEQVKQLYRENRARCAYCDIDLSADHRLRRLFTTDHLVPRKRSGLPATDPAFVSPEEMESELNQVLCCCACNGADCKGEWDPSDDGPVPKTPEERDRLIQKTREYLKPCIERDMRDHVEMLDDFRTHGL
jgi:hypothetical protein